MNVQAAPFAEYVGVVGDITRDHIGMVVRGIPSIVGWERNLLLRDIEHRDGRVYLGFRWNDDPSSRNAKRGQFAVGVTVDLSLPIRVCPPPMGSAS